MDRKVTGEEIKKKKKKKQSRVKYWKFAWPVHLSISPVNKLDEHTRFQHNADR